MELPLKSPKEDFPLHQKRKNHLNCLHLDTHRSEGWHFKVKAINLYSLYNEECEKANISKSWFVEKEPGSWKDLGEKFHMQDRHPKWLNIIYFFFMLKCTEFF